MACTMSGTVSVIIPAYNRAGMIGQAIECLLRQTLPPHEVIVVDDGSTDDTVRVARGFGSRVTVLEQANAGPGAARNRGLAAATGDFIQFFDSDDLCTSDKLAVQVRALADSGADLAYGAWVHAFISGRNLRINPLGVQQGPAGQAALPALLGGWLTFMPAGLVRRSMIDKVGGYPSTRRTGEDIELLFRLVLAGARLVHTPGPLLLVRQHGEGQISSASHLAAMRAQDQVHLVEQVSLMLAEAGIALSERERRNWRAWRWRVRCDLARLDPAQTVDFDWQAAVKLQVDRYLAGLRSRLTGSRLGRDFAPAPISREQRVKVAALGLDLMA